MGDWPLSRWWAAWGRYEFVDEWRVAAPTDRVWTFVRDVARWPDWWPAARRVVRTRKQPERWRFRFRTRLPYAMEFDSEVVEEVAGHRVSTAISGRVGGSGVWGVESLPGGTLVRFDWLVIPRPRWMRLLSPLARGVFRWNHEELMVEGGRALARELGVALLAEPLCVLKPVSRARPVPSSPA